MGRPKSSAECRRRRRREDDLLHHVSDIDECASRTHDCTREGEFCVNTNGSFTCECDTGYINLGDRCEGERVCLLPVILFRIPSRVCSHCVLLCCPGTLSCCVALALCPVVLPGHCVLLCCPGHYVLLCCPSQVCISVLPESPIVSHVAPFRCISASLIKTCSVFAPFRCISVSLIKTCFCPI